MLIGCAKNENRLSKKDKMKKQTRKQEKNSLINEGKLAVEVILSQYL